MPRGRPKKKIPDAAAQPKRGRGRPRKQPADDMASASAATTPPARPLPPLAQSAASSSASLDGEGSGPYNPSAAAGGSAGDGLRWTLALVAIALFPRVVGGTLRRLTGEGGAGTGSAGVDAAGATRRNRLLAAFMPPAGGGPGEEDKPGNGFWGMLGKLLTAGAARVALAGAVASLAVGLQLAPPGSFQLYHTVGEIPAAAFRENVVLSGRVVRVSDGDTIRVRHTPIYPLIGNTKDTGRLTEETLSIRLAGIDAPEVAKASAPGQPFARESKQFVMDKVLNKQVRIKLLSRDQYARAVCSVSYPGLFWPLRKDLSEELLKEGLAVMYRLKGAQYDGKFAYLESLEAQARAQRKGIWSKSANAELPSQYKARVAKEKAEQFLAPTGG